MNSDFQIGPSDSEIFNLQFKDRVIVSVVKIYKLTMIVCSLRSWSLSLTNS